MTLRLTAATLALAALAACTGGEVRYGAPAPVPADRVQAAYGRVAIAEVGLPAYAVTEEIQVRDDGGAITASGALWSDQPTRGVTLQLARDVGALTGGLVAPEPWPFRDFADARVDVRVEEFLATAAGTFVLSGQFFVAPEGAGRDRAERFAIEAPIAAPGDPRAIAAARADAVTGLARAIAGALR